jgi:hypothetical protein
MGMIYYAYRKRTAAGEIVLRTTDEDPEKSKLARSQLMAARLALAGFLTSAFWLSRTFVPVLYIFLCLPVLVQLVYAGAQEPMKLDSKERWKDFVRINLWCAGSIAFIWVMAVKLA